MTKMGGYLVAKALKNEGVECIFTLCGGHIQPIYPGCSELGIQIVDVRHEQAATHAADGWARVTGKPGVAVVTAGPGLTNSVTGMANAMRAGSPIVVIGGQAPLFQFEKGSLQEMNHVDLLRPITKSAKRVHQTNRIPEYINAAFREARAGRPGPVFLEIPLDVLVNSEDEDRIAFSQNSQTEARIYGDPAYIEQAAELIEASKRPVIMAGSAIWWDNAGSILEKLSGKIGAPIYVNGMARGCIDSGNPFFLNHSRGDALVEGDVIIIIGAEFDFRLGYGDSTTVNPAAKIIHIHVEPSEIGKNRAVDVGIVGDTRAVAEQLFDSLGRLKPSVEREAWLEKLRGDDQKELDRMKAYMNSDDIPIHPARLCREVDEFLGRDAIIVGDGGDIVSLGARIIRPRAPGHWLDPGPFGCLGVGLPFGLAAKLARPDKQVLLLYGDGSFGFNGMEMDTAVRFNLPIVVVIGNDGGWGQMRSGVEAMGLAGQSGVAVSLGFTRYDKMAEALGGFGTFVKRPSDIRPALERAFESGKPACVNVKINPQGARQLLGVTRGMAG